MFKHRAMQSLIFTSKTSYQKYIVCVRRKTFKNNKKTVKRV